MTTMGGRRLLGAIVAVAAAGLFATGCSDDNDSKADRWRDISWDTLTPTQHDAAKLAMSAHLEDARSVHIRLAGSDPTSTADRDACWREWTTLDYRGPADIEPHVRSSWTLLCRTQLEYIPRR